MSPSPPPKSSAAAAPRILRYQAVEGLLRGLAVEPGTEDMREVLRLGGGGDRLPDELPVEHYVAILEALARRRFPDRARPEALFQVGASMFEGYRNTLLGRVQLAALALVGPERITRKAPDVLARNSNFGSRSVEQLGPAHFALHLRGVPIPADFYRGIFVAALRAAGAAAPKVVATQRGEDTDFDVTW